MNMDDVINKLVTLLEDLGWDYDRMSESGKQTYTEICSLVYLLKEG